MRRAILACLAALTACGSAAPPSTSPPAPRPTAATGSPAVTLTPPPASAAADAPRHVAVVVEENHEVWQILGNPQAAFINSAAHRFGAAAHWHGTAHPSLPNYLALVSGSTQGVGDDGTGYVFGGATLADQLSAAGIGWGVYAEGLPSPCWNGASAGAYGKKHVPFLYFASILDSPALCSRVQPYSRLPGQLAAGTAPPFLFIVPDEQDDMHSGSVATADGWLQSLVGRLRASSWWRADADVVVTWDEGTTSSGCCDGAAGGNVLTVVISDRLDGAQLNSPGDHRGTLRGLEELYGLPLLAGAADPRNGDLRPLL